MFRYGYCSLAHHFCRSAKLIVFASLKKRSFRFYDSSELRTLRSNTPSPLQKYCVRLYLQGPILRTYSPSNSKSRSKQLVINFGSATSCAVRGCGLYTQLCQKIARQRWSRILQCSESLLSFHFAWENWSSLRGRRSNISTHSPLVMRSQAICSVNKPDHQT